MKKVILIFIFSLLGQTFLSANPIDTTPITLFSKLLFNNNEWEMELKLSFGWNITSIDSIVLKDSNAESKLNTNYFDGNMNVVITSDSLSRPLNINRDGDKISILTYSDINGDKLIREDYLIFGNYPGATVGAPVNGYSIIRIYTILCNEVYLTLDCLTKNSSSQPIDSLSSIGCTMKGHIYDVNSKLIKNYIGDFSIKGIFILETELNLDSTGTYTTTVFNTYYKPDILYVNVDNSFAMSDALRIKPLELNNIEQGTTIYRDIYLADTCKYCNNVTSIKKVKPPQNVTLTLINYPNPFNLTTNFYIKIPNLLENRAKKINIYNITGQLIRSIEYKNQTTVSWDAKDNNGNIMPSGIYYYSLDIDNQILKTGSMILLK